MFSTPEGHNLARNIPRPLLPYDPHDTRQRVCVAPTPTGYMLLLLSLATNPGLIAPAKKTVPENLVMTIIFPTNGLEEMGVLD